MDPATLQQLIGKYLDGSATPEEREQILDWYRSQDLSQLEMPMDEAQTEATGDALLAKLNERIDSFTRS